MAWTSQRSQTETMELLVLLAVVLALPTVLYLASRSKDAWGLVKRGQVTSGAGLYRATTTTVWALGNAPVSVRIAAFSSFVLGQMILPGALAALVGMCVLSETLSHERVSVALIVIQLSAPTGLVVAWRLLAAGSAMLRRAPDAVAQGRRGAAWELWHNGILGTGLVVSAIVGDRDEGMACLLVGMLVMLALGHGVLLLHAVSALEAYNAAQDAEPERAPAVAGGFAPVAR